ncbi:FliA/WhiG family RNA polymerase sigma factor [Candidatus Desantisbacteria bacterium]|nr:FliA/WhiG family RNA polymerase sigma factor [Candidatus Desantisbacteria bacterium]
MTAKNRIEENYAHQLDDNNKEALIEHYYPMIHYIAQRFARLFPPHIELDTLLQAGLIGFMRAVNNYDEKRGAMFSTFATICIKGAILEELRSLDWATRSVRQKANKIEKAIEILANNSNNKEPTDEEIALQVGVSVDKYHDMLLEINAASVLSLDNIGTFSKNFEKLSLMDLVKNINDPDPETRLVFDEQKKILGKLIETLADKEKTVITLYYYEELTMKEIGKVLNITESRVSQLHNSAVLKLRVKIDKIEKTQNLIPVIFKNKIPAKNQMAWLLYGTLLLLLTCQLFACSPKKQIKADTSPRDWQVIIFPLNYATPNIEINTQIARLLSEELNQKWRNVVNFNYCAQITKANNNTGANLQNVINELYLNGADKSQNIGYFIPRAAKILIIVDTFAYSHYWNNYNKMIKIGIKFKIFETENYTTLCEDVILENFKEEEGGIEQAARFTINKIVDSMDFYKMDQIVKKNISMNIDLKE